MQPTTATKVVKTFSILNWIFAAIYIITGIFLVFAKFDSPFVNSPGIDAAKLVFLMPIIGFFLILAGIAGAIIAYGLWKHKSWARITIIVYAVLTVFSVPLGTIISLLELWLFGFNKDVKALFTE